MSSSLKWTSFTQLVSTSSFEDLLGHIADTKYQFHKGLSIFRSNAGVPNVGVSPDVRSVSIALGLHHIQVENLFEIVGNTLPITDDEVASQAKELYFAERLSILHSISSVFEEDYKGNHPQGELLMSLVIGSYKNMEVIQSIIEKFESAELVSALLFELMEQLMAYGQGTMKSLKPMRGGVKEMECLVEILMFSFRREPCSSAGTLLELIKAIKTVLVRQKTESAFFMKLALLPMLGFGFGQALDVLHDGFEEQQMSFQTELPELDRLFSTLESGEQHPQEIILQLSWQLFRKLHSSEMKPSGSDGAVNGVYIGKMESHSIPDWINRVLMLVPHHSLSRECMLMMMSSLTLYKATFQDQIHSFKYFQVLAETLKGDYYICERLFDCKTHWKLRDVFQRSQDWFLILVYPLMTMLSAMCFPQFVTRISSLLSMDSFGAVVLHSVEDLAHIEIHSASKWVLSKAKIKPSIGDQLGIIQGAQGRLCDERDFPPWLIPYVPDSRLIKWEIYPFSTLYLYMVYQMGHMSRQQESPSLREQSFLDALTLLNFAAAYLKSMKEAGKRSILIDEEQLINSCIQWIEPFLQRDYDLSSLLYLLTSVCEKSPYRVIEVMRKSRFFKSVENSLYSVHGVLSLSRHDNQLTQMLHVAHSLIELFSEFTKQGFQFPETSGWIFIVCQQLVPRLVSKMEGVQWDVLAKLYCSILSSFRHVLMDHKTELGLRQRLLEEMKNGNCLEHCLNGILKIIPHQIDDLKVMSNHQIRLVTQTCLFLSTFLKTEDLDPQLLNKILRFLGKKTYWETQAPVSILTLHSVKAFKSSELDLAEVSCSSAAVQFLAAYMSQIPPQEEHFLSALPTKHSEIHPDFRKALVLESIYHGKEVQESLITSSVDLLVSVSLQESSFFSFLVYPSKIDPGVNSKDNSLLDVLWMGINASSQLWKYHPSILCTLLRGVRAIQKGKKHQLAAWEALTGQGSFLKHLLDILLMPAEEDLEEASSCKEAIHALSLEIIENELLVDPTSVKWSEEVAQFIKKHWSKWIDLIKRSSSLPDPSFDQEQMILVLANCCCFEIFGAMRNEGPLYGLHEAFPWLQSIQEIIIEALSTTQMEDTEVIDYVQDITSNVATGSQLQHVLLYPSEGMSFLASDLTPGKTLIDHMIIKDPNWRVQHRLMMQWTDYQETEMLSGCLAAQFQTYRLLKNFLRVEYEPYLRFYSTRNHLITSWRKITKLSFSFNSFGPAFLHELIPLLMEKTLGWCEVCKKHLGWKICEENRIPRSQKIDQFCVAWDLNFLNQFYGSLLDCCEIMTAEGVHHPEPSALLPSSPAPASLPQSQQTSQQVSQIDVSLFDQELLCSVVRNWFEILEALGSLLQDQEIKKTVQEGTKNVLTVYQNLIGKFSRNLTLKSTQESFEWILRGMLKLIDPTFLGFQVAETALLALTSSCECASNWDEHLVQAFSLEFPLGSILDYLLKNLPQLSRKEETDFQSWSSALLSSLCLMWNQSSLQGVFLDPQVIPIYWYYGQSLFNPAGPIHLTEAYQPDGEKTVGFTHWYLLLKLVSQIIHGIFPFQKPVLPQTPLQYSVIKLYDQFSTLLTASFPSLLTHEIGTQHQPLTIGRLERMEIYLNFLVASHEVFSSALHRIHQYNLRRQEVLLFLQIMDSLLHHRRETHLFEAYPISPQEKLSDHQTLHFNITGGWFQLCKKNRVESRLDDPEELPLTKLSWRLGKKVYLCLSQALVYLKLSIPPFSKEEMETVPGPVHVPSRDLLLHLQADSLTVCQHLMDSPVTSGMDVNLKMEVKELTGALKTIVSCTSEFLTDWGYARRRKHLDQFKTQLDVLQQLSLLVE